MWTYKDDFADEQVGPLDDAALLQLAFEGKVDPTTLVSHTTRTNGKWVELSKVSAVVKRYDEGIVARAKERGDVQPAIPLPVKVSQPVPSPAEPVRTPTTKRPSPGNRSVFASIVHTLCWLATIGGAMVGTLIIVAVLASGSSAIQEATGAALGIACAVIPYCIARAVSELSPAH
jgi:hypothetical protein